MKERICVMTATRAEYSLLRNVIVRLQGMDYDVKVVVTGMHLSDAFGNTIKEIEEDGVEIDARIDILSEQDNAIGVAETMAAAITGFSSYFEKTRPALFIVLGDRYETLAVSVAAMSMRIPIAHLHGGETTEGAIDECIRHAVTKMSYLHFTSCEAYRKRVIQLGECPNRVFNVGALGIENIKALDYISVEQLYQELNITFETNVSYAIVTFHPVTLEEGTAVYQVQELLSALDEFPKMNFIITKSNADEDGRKINSILEKYVMNKANAVLFSSLGMRRYLNALKHASMVIGNSSSGILEVPSFGIPTINIGDRQKGRIQAESIINCKPEKNEIINAIKKASSEDFKNIAINAGSPYGDGNASEKIVSVIEEFLTDKKIDLKKPFYDLGGNINV